jgi:hypothetical protein
MLPPRQSSEALLLLLLRLLLVQIVLVTAVALPLAVTGLHLSRSILVGVTTTILR